MPPTCSLDAPVIGPVFILEPSFNEETCKIVVPVHTNIEINETVLKDLKRATFNLEEPPAVIAGDEAGTVKFEFEPDTVEETIPGLLEIIFEEYGVRFMRHVHFQLTGPVIAVYSEIKTHG